MPARQTVTAACRETGIEWAGGGIDNRIIAKAQQRSTDILASGVLIEVECLHVL